MVSPYFGLFSLFYILRHLTLLTDSQGGISCKNDDLTAIHPFLHTENHKKSPSRNRINNRFLSIMGQPKRKQSKQRSRKRRGANQYTPLQVAKDPIDGTAFKPHHVNPANGMYRGRQVLDIEV